MPLTLAPISPTRSTTPASMLTSSSMTSVTSTSTIRRSSSGLGSSFVHPAWEARSLNVQRHGPDLEKIKSLSYRRAYCNSPDPREQVIGGLAHTARNRYQHVAPRYLNPTRSDPTLNMSIAARLEKKRRGQVRLLDDELRRQRLEEDRAAAAAERAKDREKAEVKEAEDTLRVGTQVMVRERLLEAEVVRPGDADFTWLTVGFREFKTIVRGRVHSNAPGRMLRLWYKSLVAMSGNDGSVDFAGFLIFAVREAIVRPRENVAGVESAVFKRGGRGPDYDALFALELGKHAKGYVVTQKEFVRVVETIGFGDGQLASQAFAHILAHIGAEEAKKEDSAAKAIQAAARRRKAMAIEKEREDAAARTIQLATRRRTDKGAGASIPPAPLSGPAAGGPAAAKNPKGVRFADQRRPEQPGLEQTMLNASSGGGPLSLGGGEPELAEGMDAEQLLLALRACMGKLRKEFKLWITNSTATVWEAPRGGYVQRLRLMSLGDPPRDVPRGTPAAEILPRRHGELPAAGSSRKGRKARGSREEEAPEE